MAIVTEVLARISANPQNYIAGMRDAAVATQQFQNTVDQSMTQSGNSITNLMGLVQRYRTLIAGSAVTAFTMQGVNAAAAYEQQVISFEGIFKGIGRSAEEAQQYLASLRDFAAVTPFELPGLLDATKRLLTIGYTAEDVRDRVMPAIGDMVAALGQPPQSINAVVYAMGQMKSAGRVLSQDLMQIGNALPGFNAKMAIANTLFEGNMAKMTEALEKGTLSSEQAIEAILTAMTKFPGAAGAMERQSKSLNGVLSTFRDTINNARVDGFAQSLPNLSAALNKLAGPLGRAITEMSKFLGALLPPLVTAVSAVAIPVLNALGYAFEFINTMVTAAGNALSPVLQSMKNYLEPLMPVVMGLAAGFGTMAAGMALVNIQAKMMSSFGALKGVLTGAATAMRSFAGATWAATGPIGLIVAAIAALAVAFYFAWQRSETFREVVVNVINTVAKYVGIALGAVLRAFGNLLLGFSEIMTTSSTFGRFVADIFNFVWRVISTVIGGVLTVFGLLLRGISQVIGSNGMLGRVFAAVFNFIGTLVTTVVGTVLELYGNLITGVVNLIESNQSLYNIVSTVFKGIVFVVGNVAKAFLSIVKSMIDGIGKMLQGATNLMAGFAEGLGDLVSRIPGMEALGKSIRGVGQSIRALGSSATNILTSTTGAIEGAINGVNSLLASDKTGALLNNILKVARFAGTSIANLGKTIKNFSTQELGTALFDTLAKGAGFAADMVTKLADGMLKIGEFKLGDALVNGLGIAANKSGAFLVSLAGAIESFTSDNFFAKATDGLKDLVDQLKDMLGFGGADGLDAMAKDYTKAAEAAQTAANSGAAAGRSAAKQADTMKTIRDALRRGIEQMQGVVDDLKKAAADMAKSLKETILGFAGLKAIELPDGFIPQAKSLIGNMQERLKKAQQFATQIAELQRLGLNTDSLRTIIEEGPIKGAQLAASILSGGAEAIAEINKLEKAIQVTGAGVGAFAADLVYSDQIAKAQNALARITSGELTVGGAGNNVNIQQGAFQVSINIERANGDPTEISNIISQRIEEAFARLTNSLAAK